MSKTNSGVEKTMKVFYYVDTKDNSKTPFGVVDSSKDIRTQEVIEKVSEQLEVCGFGRKQICNSVAWELTHTGAAELTCQMGNYEFGIEEVPVLE